MYGKGCRKSSHVRRPHDPGLVIWARGPEPLWDGSWTHIYCLLSIPSDFVQASIYNDITPTNLLPLPAYPIPHFRITPGEQGMDRRKEEKSWKSKYLSWVFFLKTLSFKPETGYLEVASSAFMGTGSWLGILRMV